MKPLHRLIILLFICSLVLTGCWDQRLFEQAGLALAIGIEESPNGMLYVSYTYPVINAQQKNAADIITSEVNLLRKAREDSRLTSPKFTEAGKIQEILISDSLAQKGIHDMLEVYQRDATNPAVAYIVIVEGSPKELLEKGLEFKNKPGIAYYIYQLLENNSKISNIPNTKLFDFDINFFAPGIDPVTPMIKLESNSLRLIGSALFSEDKMVGKLDNKQTIMLLGMMGQANNTDFIASDPKFASDNPDKYGVSVTLYKPKRKITINFDEEGKPIFNISLSYKCVLDEYKWNKTDDQKEQVKIEKVLKEDIVNTCNATIKKLQETNSDPMGLGNLIRAKYYEYWQSIDWKEVYKEAQINVDINIEISKEGIIK